MHNGWMVGNHAYTKRNCQTVSPLLRVDCPAIWSVLSGVCVPLPPLLSRKDWIYPLTVKRATQGLFIVMVNGVVCCGTGLHMFVLVAL